MLLLPSASFGDGDSHPRLHALRRPCLALDWAVKTPVRFCSATKSCNFE
jgi:hypothetical protein